MRIYEMSRTTTKLLRRADLPRTHVGTTDRRRTGFQPNRERTELAPRYPGGPTRCTRCPPKCFCDECGRINKQRQHAGLIRPSGDPRPSAANIYNPAVVGKYKAMGKKEYLQSPGLVVTAFVERLGGGWRRGVAQQRYEGKPTRSADEAMNGSKRINGDLRGRVSEGEEDEADPQRGRSHDLGDRPAEQQGSQSSWASAYSTRAVCK
jgi:hypothetical protein